MSSSRFSRRTFASVAAAALVQGTQLAGCAKPADPNDIGPKPLDLSSEDWGEVRAKYSNLLRVYGERLTADEKRHSLSVLIRHQHMLASIRGFVVQNDNASACTLRLYGADHV
jgi:hypothetical protein